MITIATDANILYTIVSEEITKDDFSQIESNVDRLFHNFTKVSWYYEMRNFEGWEFKTFFHASKYTLKHNDLFQKIAMVGEKKWQEWMTDLMKPFASAQVHFFESDDKEEAKKWIAE
jgi:hypothetical protein